MTPGALMLQVLRQPAAVGILAVGMLPFYRRTETLKRLIAFLLNPRSEDKKQKNLTPCDKSLNRLSAAPQSLNDKNSAKIYGGH